MITTTVEGSFSVKVLRDGLVIKELPRTKNLITRDGMIRMGFATYLAVGTGSTAPTFNDTALDNHLTISPANSWTDNTSVLNGTDYEKESQNTFTFAVGAVIGNITELAIIEGDSPSDEINTRALFKDGGGTPTAISVTAQDQLVVTYFVKKISSMATTVSSIIADIDGTPTTIDYTIRPCISLSGEGGSAAERCGSIYTNNQTVGLYLYAWPENRMSVDPVTFIPTQIGTGGERTGEGTVSVALTATGSEVTHTMTMPIEDANFTWVSATLSIVNLSSVDNVLFQIEFDGPNYIDKTASDTIVFKIKEIMQQVIV